MNTNSKPFTADEDTTLTDWIRYWFKKYKLPKIKSSTHDDYYTVIERHIIPKIGNVKLFELSADILQDFFNEEAESGNLSTGEGLSKKSIKNIRNVLNSAITKAADLDIIAKNPMRLVEIPPLEKPEMTVLSVEEERRLLNHLINTGFEGTYDFAIFLADKFGMRNGEVAALTFGSFDFDNMVIKVRSRIIRVRNKNIESESDSKTYLELSTPKTRESLRDIPFNEKFAEIAKEYFKAKSPRSNKKDNFIFMSKNNENADPHTINKYFQRKLRELGINKKIRFHDLRHTFATRAIEHNVDIKSLSVILGHTSVQFTLDRYAHVLGDQKRATMDILLSDL